MVAPGWSWNTGCSKTWAKAPKACAVRSSPNRAGRGSWTAIERLYSSAPQTTLETSSGGDMRAYYDVAIVTLATALVYFWMAAQVARTRSKVGILAPAMTGDPKLERTIRAHLNTLEWMPIFLPSLWLFAVYWNSTVA